MTTVWNGFGFLMSAVVKPSVIWEYAKLNNSLARLLGLALILP